MQIDLGGGYETHLAQPDEAQRCYEEALDTNPSSSAAVHALGLLHERQGNWYNALDIFGGFALYRDGEQHC